MSIAQLKSQLLTSGIQQSNQPLFQVINQLIDALQSVNANVTTISGGTTTPGTLPQTFLTRGIETGSLPNSAQEVAGPGITFNDLTGRRIISAAIPIIMGDSEGTDGEQGPPGPSGSPGSIGPTGPQGDAGPIINYPSIDGEDGQDGFPYPGLQGPQGVSGSAGLPGVPVVLIFDGEDGPESIPIPGPAGSSGISNLLPITLDPTDGFVGINNTVPTAALDVTSPTTVAIITRELAGNGFNATAITLDRNTSTGGGTPTNNDAVSFNLRVNQTDGTRAVVASIEGVITDVTNNVATGDLVLLSKGSGNPGSVFATEAARLTSGRAFSLNGTVNPQGVVAAPLGSIYVNQNTGYAYQKCGGAATAYGWYLIPPAGFPGPIEWNVTGGVSGADISSGSGSFSVDGGNTLTPSGVTTTLKVISNGKSYIQIAGAATSGTNTYWNTQTTSFNCLDDDIDLYARILLGTSLTAIRIWFGITSSVITNTSTLGSGSNGAICLRYDTSIPDGGWVGYTCKGAGGNTVTSTVATTAINTVYIPRIRFIRQGTPTVYFSVSDGTEISQTSDIPATGNTFFITLGVTALSNASYSIAYRSIRAMIGS